MKPGWLIGGGLAVFAAFVAVFSWAGLFDIPETDPGAKSFAAVLGLVGVALTELVAFIGLMLKQSFDQRTLALKVQAEDRLNLEAERNLALALEAQHRLGMETAIQAVGLMGTPEGDEAASSQKAGALMALADLGNVEFALALLGLVWPTDREFPSNAAMRVIDKALLSDSRSLQVDAAIELKANALRLVDGGASSMSWPSSWTHQWHSEAHRSVRELMLDTVAIVVEDLLQQENVDEGLLLSLFVELSYALDQDDDVRIKAMAALTLRALGPNFAPWETVFGTLGDVNPAEVVERAEAAIAVARDSGQIAEGSEASAARIAALVQASVSSSLPAEDQGAGSG